MRNVVILGMHRSGTSMVAEVLAASGIYVGDPADLLQSQEDNPHGFWEREDVVQLNDAILAENNATWYRPTQATAGLSTAHDAAVAAIAAGMPADRSWLIKDPRQVLTWPCWAPHLGDAGGLLRSATALIVFWLILLYLYRNRTFINDGRCCVFCGYNWAPTSDNEFNCY